MKTYTYPGFSFEIHNKSEGFSRIGTINTPHGKIDTPAFIFCGTKGSIKGVHIDQVIQENSQIILANTYHMMLQPGEDLVYKHGGLHKFMGWNGPMMTDSGGFQIFSLGHGSVASEIKGVKNQNHKSVVKIAKDGAHFCSYINGSKYFLTPEKSMEIQVKLGADLCFAFDECTPFHVSKEYTAKSMRMSHDWETKSLNKFIELQYERFDIKNSQSIDMNDYLPQSLYGIVQGGIYNDLRMESSDFVSSQNFFGNAIGGSLGGSVDQMNEIISMTMKFLRDGSFHRPVHLLGIGRIKDIFHGVLNGVDTFDCVHPTRIARHGGALVKGSIRSNLLKNPREHINLMNSFFKNDTKPIEDDCECRTCKIYSRAYIHHLLKAKEILAHTALTIHNIHFMNKLMTEIRSTIKNGSNFENLINRWV